MSAPLAQTPVTLKAYVPTRLLGSAANATTAGVVLVQHALNLVGHKCRECLLQKDAGNTGIWTSIYSICMTHTPHVLPADCTPAAACASNPITVTCSVPFVYFGYYQVRGRGSCLLVQSVGGSLGNNGMVANGAHRLKRSIEVAQRAHFLVSSTSLECLQSVSSVVTEVGALLQTASPAVPLHSPQLNALQTPTCSVVVCIPIAFLIIPPNWT